LNLPNSKTQKIKKTVWEISQTFQELSNRFKNQKKPSGKFPRRFRSFQIASRERKTVVSSYRGSGFLGAPIP
jgi:hypothetical protein